ncbi:hypothetical protein L9F63_021604, partial [Diploptera punctata]
FKCLKCNTDLLDAREVSSNQSSGSYLQMHSSTPVKRRESQNLQSVLDEIQELKKLMSEILQYHQNSSTTSSSSAAEFIRDSEVKALPPPPPPLPPTPPLHKPVLCQVTSNVSAMQPEDNSDPVDMFANVLKDLNTVTLRPVERTPGGNPMKLNHASPKQSDTLLMILKKRFRAMHLDSPIKERGYTSDEDFS